MEALRCESLAARRSSALEFYEVCKIGVSICKWTLCNAFISRGKAVKISTFNKICGSKKSQPDELAKRRKKI